MNATLFGHVKRDLFEMMLAHAYRKQKVVLSSGRESDFYIDCKAVSLRVEGAEMIGKLFNSLLQRGEPVECVGGLTMGADPLAMATALESLRVGKYMLQPFVVRKEPKVHGTKKWIEIGFRGGCDRIEGLNAAIMEDVITTGASTIKAIERVRECGLHPTRVLALVDRQEDDGYMNVLRALLPNTNDTIKIPQVEVLFTREDFERGHLK